MRIENTNWKKSRNGEQSETVKSWRKAAGNNNEIFCRSKGFRSLFGWFSAAAPDYRGNEPARKGSEDVSCEFLQKS